MYVQFIKTSVTRLYFKKVQKEIIYNVFSFPDFDWQLFIFLFENFNGVLEKTKQKQSQGQKKSCFRIYMETFLEKEKENLIKMLDCQGPIFIKPVSINSCLVQKYHA